MRLLHLSDIHVGPEDAAWDADDDLRQQLVADVESLVFKDGIPLAGILVGGDIAYSGKTKEFEKAQVWLAEIAARGGCNPGSIWMVPGNHDVNWDTVRRSAVLQEFHRAARGCQPGEVNELLRRRIYEDPVSEVLFRPLDEFNEFAERYVCSSTNDSINWIDSDVLKVDDARVSVLGLNSVIVSEKDDLGGSKGAPNMIVGKTQVKLHDYPSEIRLILCHHPPTWIKDWSEISHLFGRAHLSLFGHEHEFGWEQKAKLGPVHLFAGAVGPEPGGTPTYNLITISATSDVIEIQIMQRVWSNLDHRFEETEKVIPPLKVSRDLAKDSEEQREEEVRATTDSANVPEPVEATPLAADDDRDTKDQAKLREAVVIFLGYSIVRRLEIAEALGVLNDDDDPTAPGFFVEILRRIRDANKIKELWEELEK